MASDNKTDLRIVKTKKAIKKAFFELVEENGFERISITNITDRAMISRNTFYLHYADKFALLNDICDEICQKLFYGVAVRAKKYDEKIHFDINGAAKFMEFAANTINEDKNIYKLLLTDPGTVIFGEKIEKTILAGMSLIKDDIDGLTEYSLQYIVSGFKGVIKYLVTHDNLDISRESYNFAKIHLEGIIEMLKEKKMDR